MQAQMGAELYDAGCRPDGGPDLRIDVQPDDNGADGLYRILHRCRIIFPGNTLGIEIATPLENSGPRGYKLGARGRIQRKIRREDSCEAVERTPGRIRLYERLDGFRDLFSIKMREKSLQTFRGDVRPFFRSPGLSRNVYFLCNMACQSHQRLRA
jgi:hypothetical protein